MNRLALVTFLGFAMLQSSGLLAADPDPTGTWKWTVTNQQNQNRDVTLQLKLEGEKLSGSVPGPNKTQIEIENATFKDGQVSFTVTRQRNDQKVTQKFNGKLEGDTITGKIENPNGNSRDWVAKREKS